MDTKEEEGEEEAKEEEEEERGEIGSSSFSILSFDSYRRCWADGRKGQYSIDDE